MRVRNIKPFSFFSVLGSEAEAVVNVHPIDDMPMVRDLIVFSDNEDNNGDLMNFSDTADAAIDLFGKLDLSDSFAWLFDMSITIDKIEDIVLASVIETNDDGADATSICGGLEHDMENETKTPLNWPLEFKRLCENLNGRKLDFN